ncbi:alpha/beta hydrolase [Flammeovirga sp. EKP202]|uniref:alpha/beta hydrolase n=1 Tax=Flammeovirga sp. EKP202 TaxID=2770592 RepID=UPI00165F3080|nr:alpha/beta hydrolase [Flammeovirga sp. EKP202]MBD0403083.1 alpha/beta hydrolase [Flammeovirga sp. EKP202]
MKLSIKKISLSLIAFIVFFYAVISIFTYTQTCLIQTHQGTSKLQDEKENGSFDTAWLDKVSREDFEVTSEQGYTLSGTYLEAPEDSVQLTAVMVHGVTHDRWRMMRYAQIYLKHGIDVVLYDHRKHGLSGGGEVSFSFFESQDLEKVVQWAKKRKPNDMILAHGESLGGATVTSHSGINETTHSVDFYIADCPFSDTKELLAFRAEEDFHVPDLGFMNTSSIVTKLMAGFYLGDASPIQNVKKSKVPFLFIHGKDDKYIPMQMTKDLFEAKEFGEKYIWLVPDAKHAKSITVAPVMYEITVMNYINTVLSQLSK